MNAYLYMMLIVALESVGATALAREFGYELSFFSALCIFAGFHALLAGLVGTFQAVRT